MFKRTATKIAMTLLCAGLMAQTASAATPKIVSGDNFNYELRSDGSIFSWGDNYSGQLADGSTNTRAYPVKLTNITGVVDVAAGGEHALFLKSDGTVWAVGLNDYGQLGDGTLTTRYTPVQVKGLSGITKIYAGFRHSLAIRNDGTLWAWGGDNSGELGDGGGNNKLIPVNTGITNAKDASAGLYSTLLLKTDGSVWAFGRNSYAELGTGNTIAVKTPTRLTGLPSMQQVMLSNDHALALTTGGTVYAWGTNHYGQLGVGDITTRYYPTLVPNLSGVTRVASGDIHSLALKTDGTMMGWGRQSDLGIYGASQAQMTPTLIYTLSNVSTMDAGKYHSIAITSDEKTWGFGDNNYRQLANTTATRFNYPIEITGFTKAPAPATYSETYNLESPHPYPENYNNTWTISKTGAKSIRVHFSSIDVEANYDYVKTSAGDNFSGSYPQGTWSNWLTGSSINVTLTSDSSVSGTGFYIDRIEYTM